jgi:hypothetical protein
VLVSRRAAAFVACTVLLAGLAEAAYSVISVDGSLRTAGNRFGAAASSLEDMRFKAARTDLRAALVAAHSARSTLRRPALVMGSRIPGLARDVESLDALARVAELSARAGLEVVSAAGAAGVAGGGFGALYSGLEVRVDSIEAMEPRLNATSAILSRARTLLEGTRPFLSPVQNSVSRAKSGIRSAVQRVRTLRSILAPVPGLVGGDGSRRYLLALQGPNEARGAGGLIGLYGIVGADEGRLRLEHVGRIEELIAGLEERVWGPAWFRRLYGPMGALGQWEQANSSPNFPVVAGVLLRMYEAVSGRRLDGVISMDPIALAELTHVTGPLVAAGLAKRIRPDNAARILLHDTYFDFSKQRERDSYLFRLIHVLWRKLTDSELDTNALVRRAARAANTGHLSVYARRPAEQKALMLMGLDGGLSDAGPNLQLVFHNNAAANKVDYFLKRRVYTTVELLPSGIAEVMTRVVLRNEAPRGPASYFLGPGIRGDAPGLNRMLLGFLLPKGARVRAFKIGERVRPLFRGRDGGFPVAWEAVEIAAGTVDNATIHYRIPYAWTESGDTGHFELTLMPQSRSRPDWFSLKVVTPRGFSYVAAGQDTPSGDNSYRYTGHLESLLEVSLRFARA